MGLIHIKERGGDDEYRFKKALKDAKEAIEEICEIYEEMEDEFGSEADERYGMRERYSSRAGYRRRVGAEGIEERRYRDSRGRFV